jgi:plasmid stability protein
MATLNIKNMPDALYRKLQKRAKQQRRSLAQEVTQILAEAVEGRRTYSILELQGLGKEVWKGIDADEHVEAERKSWD